MEYIVHTLCSSRKYPYSPTEGIGISWGGCGVLWGHSLQNRHDFLAYFGGRGAKGRRGEREAWVVCEGRFGNSRFALARDSVNWNFQRGGGLRKTPFHGGGMDIFWNYTFDEIWGVWIADETLSLVFDISSQSKQKLKSKWRRKIIKICTN